MKLTQSFVEGATSYAEVEHHNNFFFGSSTVVDEDKPFFSEYTGCRFAHIKAQIKAKKYDLKLAKQECDLYKNFVKSCEQYKNWNKDDKSARVVYRQLNRRIEKVNKIVNEINIMIENLKISMRAQDQLNKKLTERKEKSIMNLLDIR